MSNQEYLHAALNAAKNSGRVHTVKDFAALMGVDRANMSSALNGSEKHLTEKLIHRVEREMKRNGIVVLSSDMMSSSAGNGVMQNVTGSHNSVGIPPKNFDNEKDWFALVAEKDKQIDRLLTIIENMNK